jgi:hypothetical protein
VSVDSLRVIAATPAHAPSYPTKAAIERELVYDAARPSRVAWIVLLAGTILAVASISIAGFWTIVMTYLGVNYVLASGLHSYGFGGSSVVNGMVVVAIVEVVLVTAGWIADSRNRRVAEALGVVGRLPTL